MLKKLIFIFLCTILITGCTNENDMKSDSKTGVSSVEKECAGTFSTPDKEDLVFDKDFDISQCYITDKLIVSNHYYIDEEGVLWGNGYNDAGQLGLNKAEDLNKIDTVYSEYCKIAEDVVHVDCSTNGYFVIYLTSEGDLYGFGYNMMGVLLNEVGEHDRLNPHLNVVFTPKLLMKEVTYARAGRECIAVLTEGGAAYWWGEFPYSDYTGKTEPKLMLEDAKYVTTGDWTAAAISKDNELYTWGHNTWGNCGVGGEDIFIEEATKVLENVVMVWPESLMFNSPENQEQVAEEIYKYDYENTFALLENGDYVACGKGIGQMNKTADVPGEIEKSENSSYSPEFLYIEIEEVGAREKAPVEMEGVEENIDNHEENPDEEVLSADESVKNDAIEDSDEAMQFATVNEEVTAKDRTNLRDIPSQGNDSNIMVVLENGEVAVRTGKSDKGWSRIEYEGTTYYAVSSYLTTDLNYKAPEPEKDDGLKTKFVTVSEKITAKDAVNLRTLPSVTHEDSKVVVKIPNGEVVTRTGINTEVGWSRVEYNGQTLYCISSYVETVE